MSNKKGIKYKSKSTLILNNYTPEDIQKLLNSGEFKAAIIRNLGIHIKTFNDYIKEYNLIYKLPDKPKIHSKKPNIIKEKNNSYQEPLEIFKKLFDKSKKRKNFTRFKRPLLLIFISKLKNS
jgi:hypothetical protein